MNVDWNLENKKEVLKIADILLCVSRKDNRGKKIDSAYTAFDSNDIFKYGCDRLNSATALVLKGYKQQTYGVWEEHVDFVHGSEFICSFCKQGIQHYYGQNFCDVCGSKMREEFDELGTDFLGEENNMKMEQENLNMALDLNDRVKTISSKDFWEKSWEERQAIYANSTFNKK